MFKHYPYLIIFLSLKICLFGGIETTRSLKCLFNHPLDKDTLILFDIDQTLVFSDLAIHQPPAQKYRELFQEIADQKLSSKLKEEWISRVILQERLQLIESDAPCLIEKLKQTQAKVIALTARKTGHYGQIESMEKLRLEQLKKLDLRFSLLPTSSSSMAVFNQKHRPLYLEGIIFTDLLPKDLVLKEWLRMMNWSPKQIIFIDDQISNLQQVQVLADNLKIPFIGYFYQGCDHLPVLDSDLLELQLFLFFETGHWWRDEETADLNILFE